MPKLNAVNLTERMVQSARATPGGRLELWDARSPGLCLRISESGSRSWVVRYRTRDGRQPRLTLGPAEPALGGLSLEEARDLAHDVRREARRGGDPAARQRAALAGPQRGVAIVSSGGASSAPVTPTLREAWDRFRVSHLERKKRSPETIRGYRDHMERLFADWLDQSLAVFGEDPRFLADRHDLISADNGPAIANGAMRSFRAVYNHARKTCRSLPADNPVSAIDWNPQERKNTAMGASDLPAWFEQLAGVINPIRREFHLLTLLSGSRPEALKQVRVTDIDLGKRLMHLAKPKGGELRAFDIPLSRAMIQSICRLRRIGPILHPDSGRDWLFPGDAPCGHMTEHKEDRSVLSHWGNDLRQTYRTLAQAAEVSEVDMHLLMNHALPGVNSGYITRAKLMRDHLRTQQERLSAYFLKAALGREHRPEEALLRWLNGGGRGLLEELMAEDPDAARARTGARAVIRKLEVQAARITVHALPTVLIEAPSRRTRAGRESLLKRM